MVALTGNKLKSLNRKEKENRKEIKQLSSTLNGRKAIQDVSLALFEPVQESIIA
jgi:hypothetical protein